MLAYKMLISLARSLKILKNEKAKFSSLKKILKTRFTL